MLLTDWLKHLAVSGSAIRARRRSGQMRRNRSTATSLASICSQPELLEKRALLSAASILLSDISGSTGFQIVGEPAPNDDRFGNSIRAAGDVNGDGFEDVIIGAYEQNDDVEPFVDMNSGAVYVLFGKSSGFSMPPDVNDLQPDEGFRILGTDRSDTGTAVSGGGDINGDGFDDLVVAAPNYSMGAINDNPIASSYVIFGKANNTDVQISSIDAGASDSVGFRLTGFESTNFNTRDSISTGGDINGDGYDDVVFGAPKTRVDGVYGVGAAYVVFGKSSGFSNLDITDINGTNGFSFTDSARGYSSTAAYVGAAVSLRGDVNGDGFDDLIVGAPGQNKYRASAEYDGEAYVVFGRSSFSSTPTVQASTLNGSNGFVATGLVGQQARTGFSVSSGGDVNGDGIDDFVIGAPGDGYGYGSANGRAYVVFGKTNLASGGTIALESLSGSNGFVLNGETADLAGSSVSITGDINGDGFDDIAIGAPSVDQDVPSPPPTNGKAYVVFGATSINVPSSLGALDGVNGFSLSGSTDNYAGRTVAIGGDLNGDGFDELLVGEPGAPSGKVYFLYGTDFGLNNGVGGDGELGNGRQVINGSGNGTVNATQGSGADILVGGGGDDTLNADGGSDVLIGGQGDDTLVAHIGNFAGGTVFPRFDGGTGVDILTGGVSFAGQTIDLTAVPGNRINDIEVIDLADSATETIVLDLATVLAITGAGPTTASSSPFATNNAHTLTILRDSDDIVNGIADGMNGWTQGANQVIDSKTFEVFTQAGATVRIQTFNALNLDVDENGSFEFQDGILIALAKLNFDSFILDNRGSGSTLTVNEIKANVTNLGADSSLDVDENGSFEFQDGILIALAKLNFDSFILDNRGSGSTLTVNQIKANVSELPEPPAARAAFPAQPSTDESEPVRPEAPSFLALPAQPFHQNGESVSAKPPEGDESTNDVPSTDGDTPTTDEAFVSINIEATMDLLS